jgi:phage gpG-like protein
MTGAFSLLGFVEHVRELDHDMKAAEHAIVARACEMVCAEARRVIGIGYPEWPALSPETLARKMRDAPLLETGQMRDSIEWNSHGNEGHVGSNNDKAVWHELGTAKIPPRSFLAGAAARMEGPIHAMAAKAVHAVMRGESLHGSEMMELLHLLHHIGREVNEAVQHAIDHGDEKGNR